MSDRGREEATTASPFTVTLPSGDAVSAMAYPAAGAAPAGTTMILAHGAGAPQTHPFMTAFARLLSARGIDVVTFNFLYMERGRRVPDPKARLEACYRAVIAAARTRAGDGDRRMVIGGKSMGGRIATQVAAADGADGGDLDVDGLVLLGYPLHPPGRPDKPRTAHLPAVAAPMLFVQGERDVLAPPASCAPSSPPAPTPSWSPWPARITRSRCAARTRRGPGRCTRRSPGRSSAGWRDAGSWRERQGENPERAHAEQPAELLAASAGQNPLYSAGAPFGGQRSPRLRVTASKGRMRTGASSCAVAISTHSPLRSSKASRVRSAGSTSHR